VFQESQALDSAHENLINLQLDELYMECDDTNRLEEIIAKQDNIIEAMAETLKYYANRDVYTKLGEQSIYLDVGQRAQNALILVAEELEEEPAHKAWLDDIKLEKGFKFIELMETK